MPAASGRADAGIDAVGSAAAASRALASAGRRRRRASPRDHADQLREGESATTTGVPDSARISAPEVPPSPATRRLRPRPEQLGDALVGNELEQRHDPQVLAARSDQGGSWAVEREAGDDEAASSIRLREPVEEDVEVLVAAHVAEGEETMVDGAARTERTLPGTGRAVNADV